MPGRYPRLAVMGCIVFCSARVDAQSPQIQSMVARVDAHRIAADVAALAALGTRMATLGEFQAATDLVRQRLEQTGLQVHLDPFPLGEGPDVPVVENVVALVPGSLPRPPIMVTAHYDSISFADPRAAPGAEDNASGTAAVLELARVLAGEQLATPVQLVALAAEEEGLWGSRHMAQSLTGKTRAVINLDMVGYHPAGTAPQVVLDGSSRARSLIGRMAWTCERYVPQLAAAGSVFSAARSDHRSFDEVGIVALTVASLWTESYPYYHSADDLPSRVDSAMVADVTRMVAAHVVLMAGLAQGPPVASGDPFVVACGGERVTLGAADSFDPGGQPLTFRFQPLPPASGPTVVQDTLTLTADESGMQRYLLVARASDGRESEPELMAVVVEDGGCSFTGRPPAGTGWLVLLLLVFVRRPRRAAAAR